MVESEKVRLIPPRNRPSLSRSSSSSSSKSLEPDGKQVEDEDEKEDEDECERPFQATSASNDSRMTVARRSAS